LFKTLCFAKGINKGLKTKISSREISSPCKQLERINRETVTSLSLKIKDSKEKKVPL
jgi:hypothetical protein